MFSMSGSLSIDYFRPIHLPVSLSAVCGILTSKITIAVRTPVHPSAMPQQQQIHNQSGSRRYTKGRPLRKDHRQKERFLPPSDPNTALQSITLANNKTLLIVEGRLKVEMFF